MSEASKPTISLRPACTCGGRCHERAAMWEDDMRAALKMRERLNQAEAFIDHMDMHYRWLEWLEEDEDE